MDDGVSLRVIKMEEDIYGKRFVRLSPGSPARALFEEHVFPRLKHRPHEVWQRACTGATRRRQSPPNPPDEDAAPPFKP